MGALDVVTWFCSEFLTDSDRMKKKKEHDSVNTVCPTFNKTISSHKGMLSHYKAQHTKDFECISCSKCFESRYTLPRHKNDMGNKIRLLCVILFLFTILWTHCIYNKYKAKDNRVSWNVDIVGSKEWCSPTFNSSIVKSPIKFMFSCACVNHINKLIPIKSAIEIPLKIALFNAIF